MCTYNTGSEACGLFGTKHLLYTRSFHPDCPHLVTQFNSILGIVTALCRNKQMLFLVTFQERTLPTFLQELFRAQLLFVMFFNVPYVRFCML